MAIQRGSDDDVGGHDSDPWAGDGGARDADEGIPGIVGGGARGFGQTGEVLSRKNRLQVRFSGREHTCVSKIDRCVFGRVPSSLFCYGIACVPSHHDCCVVYTKWSPCYSSSGMH